jgi:hypothetical protein
MLRRARRRLLRSTALRVPVVDVEALIGLKGAGVRTPSRRFRDPSTSPTANPTAVGRDGPS